MFVLLLNIKYCKNGFLGPCEDKMSFETIEMVMRRIEIVLMVLGWIGMPSSKGIDDLIILKV
ncbi:hypothetical protein Syun_018722 [Stephania yunnanensis]|uniref:Uncharacterized protein n=1 Tax=Stephania yunnanensis TaxID=152371 RepID=A0AAP0NXA1_9MAGN